MKTSIRVQNLGKEYRIGARRDPNATLRETVSQTMRAPLKWLAGNGSSTHEKIWALKGVTFEVQQGEVVGIIGRNGAGKSTLLKILSRITEPTTGRVELFGRVGSLLEVGTGFHPELTGRENVYLNGAILGMRRGEIDRKFDEIVAFSEIEKFLDTPVKRYSSGMYMRLAFAVAAHLEPEILIVDEVLAVGDTSFQKKCLGKIKSVSQAGESVLFVSHNVNAIQTLCDRVLLIEDGLIVADGKPRDVISKYMDREKGTDKDSLLHCRRTGNGRARIASFSIESPEGEELEYISSGSDVVFKIGFILNDNSLSKVSMGFSIHTETDFGLALNYNHFSATYFDALPREGSFLCRLNDFPFSPGKYLIRFRMTANGEEVDAPELAMPIRVHMGDFYRANAVDIGLASWGPILIRGAWSLQEKEEVLMTA
jgi:lipopolysaccharide transport system ATP-binding protein